MTGRQMLICPACGERIPADRLQMRDPDARFVEVTPDVQLHAVRTVCAVAAAERWSRPLLLAALFVMTGDGATSGDDLARYLKVEEEEAERLLQALVRHGVVKFARAA